MRCSMSFQVKYRIRQPRWVSSLCRCEFFCSAAGPAWAMRPPTSTASMFAGHAKSRYRMPLDVLTCSCRTGDLTFATRTFVGNGPLALTEPVAPQDRADPEVETRRRSRVDPCHPLA